MEEFARPSSPHPYDLLLLGPPGNLTLPFPRLSSQEPGWSSSVHSNYKLSDADKGEYSCFFPFVAPPSLTEDFSGKRRSPPSPLVSPPFLVRDTTYASFLKIAQECSEGDSMATWF